MISQCLRSFKHGVVPNLLKGRVFLTKRNFLTALLAFSVGMMLLFESAEIGEGIRKGLYLCSFSVVPALFPFMALSVFICKSSAADFFNVLFKPVLRFLKIPQNCGGILLSAIIGGYPAAAKCINDLVMCGGLDRKSAARLLCFCVNAGPSFLIGAVGIGVFGSIKIGFLLFSAQFLSAAIIAVFLSFFSEKTKENKLFAATERSSNASCVIESVVSAAESCFRMCAFIILACGTLELVFEGQIFSAVSNIPAAKAFLTGFFEVTAGCLACGEINGFWAVASAGAIASFSGISVILQISALTDRSGISLVPFLISRLFHSVITFCMLWFFLLFSGETAFAFSVKGGSYEAVLSASAPAFVSLLCMAALFLLSLVPPKSEKELAFSRIWNIIASKPKNT